MRPPRWALALTAIGALGSVALVGLPAGSALADAGRAGVNVPARYQLTAQGDAMYFEVNSQSIPASPNNSASSLYTRAELGSNGSSQAEASSPYYGSTVQNLPGTANGVPGGFGLGQLQFPFTRLPGFVESRFPSPAKSVADGGWYRVSAESEENASIARGEQGAPPGVPAPNQQETSDAGVRIDDKGAGVAEASGTASGIVEGPLEVGNSTAQAIITDALEGSAEPQIQSKSFGRFTVGGQEFGFDQNGFRYLGQEMSQKDAVQQANGALKAANIQLAVAPVETSTNDSTGITTHTIGGLMITTTQALPGASPLTVTYILGRASVSSVNVALGTAVENATAASTSDANSAARKPSSDDATIPNGTESGSSGGAVESGGISGAQDNGAEDNGAPDSTEDSGTAFGGAIGGGAISGGAVDGSAISGGASGSDAFGAGALPAVTGGTATQAAPAAQELPRTLGFVPAVGEQQGGNNEGLYLMLVLVAGAVLGAPVLFSRIGALRG